MHLGRSRRSRKMKSKPHPDVPREFQMTAEDGFMSENEVYNPMTDRKFFLASTAEAKKFLKGADWDRDGMISLQDFQTWVRDGPCWMKRV